MPNVSGSPTQNRTSQPTIAALEGTPADQFNDGDQGYVDDQLGSAWGPFYFLQRAASAVGALPAVNGTTVLSVYQQPTDRWLSLSVYGTGSALKEERFTAGAGQTVFPLAGKPNGKTILAVNGVVYEEGVGQSYTLTLIAGVYTITWLDNPFVLAAGFTVAVYYTGS